LLTRGPKPDCLLGGGACCRRPATIAAASSIAPARSPAPRKTRRRLDEARLEWEDPPEETRRGLARDLAACARAHGMRLTVCAQRELVEEGVGDASCIDPGRLAGSAGIPIVAPATPHRPTCGCSASRDIGDYDTCPFGCVFCYAVGGQARAVRRYRAHDPESEFLLAPPAVRRFPLRQHAVARKQGLRPDERLTRNGARAGWRLPGEKDRPRPRGGATVPKLKSERVFAQWQESAKMF
jgi:hypothetical protein